MGRHWFRLGAAPQQAPDRFLSACEVPQSRYGKVMVRKLLAASCTACEVAGSEVGEAVMVAATDANGGTFEQHLPVPSYPIAFGR